MTALHNTLGWITIIANAAVGLWALGAHRWAGLRAQSLWYAVAAAQILVVTQACLGTYLVASVGAEPEPDHMLYGFSTVVAVAILYGYRTSLRHQLYLLYGLGSLFLMGLGLRAVQLS